ncbi:MAG TPA: fructosamine kinase family protein [Acidiferrobacterales bacterium]|nr:fructosamine kinase family protein [Acidiferrobacterales bacterium]
MSLQEVIARAITQATGEVFRPEGRRGVSGGDINAAEVLEGSGLRYFVKLNDAARLAMFEAESEGLAEIAESRSVRVPQPVCSGAHGGQAYLVLEYLVINRCTGKSDELLGRQLAAMHRSTRDRFGWHRDNTIGSTRQINAQEGDWVTFYREHRLRFQLELAEENGFAGNLMRRSEQLLETLPAFFTNHKPQPSLLHGDLWGGNHAALHDGTPVIFDPAVYYGDREADLAMTELFGGFGPDFYAAYRETWPLDPGYHVRRDLYNLYHVLNHLNLFGGGYRGQAEQLIERLLNEA